MIALEMRNLGGGEILHACPQESLDKPLPCIVFLSWLYLVEAGLQLLCGGAGRGRIPGDHAGRAGAWGALSGR